MLRRLFRRLFTTAPAVPDWTAGWEHRRDRAPDTQDGRRHARHRPEPITCGSMCRASWDA